MKVTAAFLSARALELHHGTHHFESHTVKFTRRIRLNSRLHADDDSPDI
jgi:hypothetical protein